MNDLRPVADILRGLSHVDSQPVFTRLARSTDEQVLSASAYYRWRFDEDAPWPCEEPQPTDGPDDHIFGVLILPESDEVGVIRVVSDGGRFRRMTLEMYARKPVADYWPSVGAFPALAQEWAGRMLSCMLGYVGQDFRAPTGDAADHWLNAKRRYGSKNNQTETMVFAADCDPEGRHIRIGEPMPEHVERWLRYADFLVGVRVGVDPASMVPDDLWASGGTIDEGELLVWCRDTLKETTHVR